MATPVSQNSSLAEQAKTEIIAASNLAQLKSACRTLVRAVKRLERKNENLRARIKRMRSRE